MRYIALLAILVVSTSAQTMYKLCVTEDMYYKCNALQRGDSRVTCLKVTDSAECAIRLSRGEADFGFFNAEELLLAYQFYPNEIAPIFQLKHRDRMNEEFEFQTVAVVPSSINNTNGDAEFRSLRNGGLCHPGYSETQWLNDYILKYFERKVAGAECESEITAAENEAQHIKNFFGKACRPGEWVAQTNFDGNLKRSYPELCELCDSSVYCTYRKQYNHGHFGALDCLQSGRGKVAYVALAYVREYFQSNDSYNFLCMDGRTQPLSTEAPCAWIKQPWGVIAARKQVSIELAKSLKEWLTPMYGEAWTAALQKIVEDEGMPEILPENTSMAAYLSKGREIDLPFAQTCKHPSIRWCTIGDLETNKCQWVSKAAQALGIEPEISCEKSSTKFECFRSIANEKTDIMTIDSNYGYLARTVYDLRTVLYSETANDKNSVVVAVVRESDENKVSDFESLKGRKACFPEYSGIAWLSFVRVARTSGVITSKSCDYPKLVADFLSGACTPGVRDTDHSNRTADERRPKVISNLCSSCPMDGDANFCAANENNPYFGDDGALKCLDDGSGDIAFIEARNLKNATIDPKKYRVLCRNGSLASYPGFDVGEFCALSVTIDSEIVGRKDSSEVDILDTTLALLKIEDWLGYSVHNRRPISIYQKFNGTSNLLFKDSTSGLVNTSSTLPAVLAYKELFSHVEACSGAGLPAIASLGYTIIVTVSAMFFSRLL